MGRAGEAVGDKWIPCVPSRAAVTILTAEQSQEQCCHREISDCKDDFVEERPIGYAAKKFKQQLCAGRIKGAEFRVINFCSLRKIMTQIIQFRIGWCDQVRVEPSVLNFAFPLISEKLVAWDERQRDQSQDYRDAPKQDRLF